MDACSMRARVMGLAAAINLQRPLRAEGNVGMEHITTETMISSAHFSVHPPSRRIFSSVLAACLLALAGCGGQANGEEPGAAAGDPSASSGDESSDGPAPNGVVNKSGSGSVTARIGSPGGSLTL